MLSNQIRKSRQSSKNKASNNLYNFPLICSVQRIKSPGLEFKSRPIFPKKRSSTIEIQITKIQDHKITNKNPKKKKRSKSSVFCENTKPKERIQVAVKQVKLLSNGQPAYTVIS